MIKETPVFPGFFLGSFLYRTIKVNDYIMVIPDGIDLNPPVTRFHTNLP